MNQFKVSALKYRPKEFEDVIGQKPITDTLEKSIKTSQLAQALLFCGPRGVGKTTCARILSKKINSDTISANDFSYNIFELDAASNNSVEDIRRLNDQVRIPPQSGLYKVYIIDEAHMLSTSAFNAFLKTLEEPPKYVIFILATTEKNKILPTILSRCQIFEFKRISLLDIKNYLIKISNENEEEVALITHYQFFSVLIGKKIYILNRWYFPRNNTHPTNTENKYYQHYTDRINNFIEKKKIKKIYLVKTYPKEFWFINFKEILNNTCFEEKKHNEILYSINIKNC